MDYPALKTVKNKCVPLTGERSSGRANAVTEVRDPPEFFGFFLLEGTQQFLKDS